MIRVRQIDFYTQLVLLLIVAGCLPFLFHPISTATICVLVCWQSLSAAFNVLSFINSGYKKQIALYGICAVLAIAVLLLNPFHNYRFDDGIMKFACWLVAGSYIVLAFYYLKIYRSLINGLDLRRELGGFTR
jgi:hypothetical protein